MKFLKTMMFFVLILPATQILADDSLIDGRYQDNKDGTVIDIKTNLTWMRCFLGQEWNGDTCTGNAKLFTWEEASQQSVSYANRDDWRTPTIKELHSLVYCSNATIKYPSKSEPCQGKPGMDYIAPTINNIVFPVTSAFLSWSSSAKPDDAEHAWSINFLYGNDVNNKRDYRNHVRLVHE